MSENPENRSPGCVGGDEQAVARDVNGAHNSQPADVSPEPRGDQSKEVGYTEANGNILDSFRREEGPAVDAAPSGGDSEEQQEERNPLEDDLEDEKAFDEDLDDEDNEAEEDDGYAGKPQKSKKKRRNIFVDDAAEEDDDEDYRKKRSRFIDDIADVDDDEEDDDEEEGVDDLIDDAGEQPTAQDLAEVRQAMREAEIQARKDEEIDPEELKKYLAERYSKERTAAYAATDMDEADTAVLQQALMPTKSDPKLWVIRCADGAERDIVVRLMQKCYDYATKGTPLQIKSAFCKDNLKGFIYVEARSESHVLKALSGLRSVFFSKKPKLVPIEEMVTAVTYVKPARKSVTPGSWVRMKSGLYKGDLARVEFVDVNDGRAVVKLLPRLDMAGMAAKKAAKSRGAEAPKRTNKSRPLPKPFIPEEARAFNLDVMHQRDRMTGEMQYVLNNSQRFVGGYLVKSVALKMLNVETSAPPLDELQRFDAASQSDKGKEDVSDLLKGFDIDAGTTIFASRDKVEVKQGELQGVRGTVVRVTDDGQIMVRLDDSALAGIEPISFNPAELRKHVDVGAHVKVINGSHKGQTGMVVSVEDVFCHIVTDATREDIRVFIRDITEAVAVATTLDTIGDYELFDLVVLDAQTVGVIVGVDKDSCKVLTNQGRPDAPDVRICRLPDMKRKIVNRRASAIDGSRNEVHLGDIVEIFEGPLRGKSGTVKHIMRGSLFIQSRDAQENSGFMCVQARQAKVRGGKRIPGSTGAGVLATPARSLATPNPYGASNVLASPAHHGGQAPTSGRFGGGGGYTGRLSTQHDKLLEGKKVDIKKGPYRGMRGTIKSATGSHVRVELEARMQTVTVSRSHLSTQDGGIIAQPSRQSMGMGMGMGIMAPGGMTPAHWSGGVTATPAHYSALGSATPMYSTMTPGREVTNTPAYDPAWAATPAHPGFGPGSAGVELGGDAYAAPVLKGPAATCIIQDWVGLYASLQDGSQGRVMGVTDDGIAELNTDGKTVRIGVGQLSLAPVAAGDSVRILVGNSKGVISTVQVVVAEKGEIFLQNPGEEGVRLLRMGECGKVAV